MAKQLEARVAELEKLVASLKTSEEKVTKEKPNTNKDGTPKKAKAKTGYLVFSSEKREEVKEMLEKENDEAPKPKDVNEIHKFIKDVVQSISTKNLAPLVLYGGSVTDKNSESFFGEEFVDGALIGGASLDGTTFAKIVNIFNTI